MNYYEFKVFVKGTSHNLAIWQCDARTEQNAVMKFIHYLSDLRLCKDEYTVAKHRAIIVKLAGKEYEVVEYVDGYTDIILNLTADDLYPFI